MAQGPQVLPNGEAVLFTLATSTAPDRWDKATIVVQSLKGQRKTLVEGGSDARYLPTGHLVYALGGTLFAVVFDAQRLEVKGGPVPIVEGVRRSAGSAATGAAHYSVSSTGSLIYVSGPAGASSAQLDLALADRKGGLEPLKLPPRLYQVPRVSPDGTNVVFGTNDGKEAIVWIYALSGASAMRRLTFGGNNRLPIWSPDSKRVAFQSDREGDLAIFSQSADGTGTATRFTKAGRGESHTPESWSPKGDQLLFSITKGADVSLWTVSIQDGMTAPFGAVRTFIPTGARFSPDGRWVAYSSAEPGKTTVYVQPFPATGAKYEVFSKGGADGPHAAVWSPDGKELFYIPRPGGFEAVSVTTRSTFAFGHPVPVSRSFNANAPTAPTSYDITPGGKFMVLVTPQQLESGTQSAPQIQVVLNWFEELKAKVPAK